MRIDKLTTKFQEALADAQTLALGGDQSNIEPLHLLVALLRQDDGPRSLLQRAGANVGQLQAAAEKALADLPRVQHQDQVQVGSELGRLLQATEKEALKRGDQFIASELFLLALTDSQLSPLASRATVTLLAQDAATFGFRSLTSTLTLAQSLFLALAYRMELAYEPSVKRS